MSPATASREPDGLDSHRVAFAAIFLPLAALALQSLWWDQFSPLIWFLFYPTVFLAPLIGRVPGGIGATLLSVALVWYFFAPPRFGFTNKSDAEVVSALLFVTMGVCFSVFQEAQRRRMQRRVEQFAGAKFRALLDASPDAITILDPQTGRFIDCNAAAVRLAGFGARSELIGLAPLDLAAERQPDGRPTVAHIAEHLHGALQAGDARAFEWLNRRLDGSEYVVHLSLSPIEIDGRRCLLGIGRDISDMKRAEDALRASERLYRSLFDAETDAILLIDVETARILDANAAAERLYGYAHEEFLGLHLLDLSAEPRQSIASLQNKERFVPLRLHRRKDGSALLIEIAANQFVINGRTMSVAAIRDVSERERTEQALRASEERLQIFVEHAPAALAMFDRNMRYLVHSRRWIEVFGLGNAELAGRLHYEVFPEIREARREVHRRGLDGEVVTAVADRFDRRDGSVQWLDWEVHPWRQSDGKVGGIVIFVEDVTEARRHDEQMRNLAQAVEQSPESIVITDLEARIEYVNPAFSRNTGYTLDEVRGKNPRLLKSGKTSGESYGDLWRKLKAGKAWKGEFVNRRKDGTEFVELASISPVRRADGTIMRYVAVKEDITQRKADEARINFLAHHDALTSLPNRALASDRFRVAVSYAERSTTRMALLFIDLDGFKSINDALGHHVGDEMLVALAVRFLACLRDTDTLCRQGGDEFMVILTDVGQAQDVSLVADKLLDSLRAPIPIGEHALTVTASVGIALYPDDGRDLETLMKKADTAMYVAKEGGGGHYRYFDEDFNVAAAEAFTLRNELRAALEADQFVLYYQPLVDVETGRVTGAEALIRWQSPQRGLVAPGVFMPLAEDSGLVVPIGEWVLNEACRQAADWVRGLRVSPGTFRIAVNLSAVQFARGNLEAAVTGALRRSRLDPDRLELELTESILIKDPESVLKTVERLRRLGISFSIDDFGTGYSSLAYLKRFPVEKLKIDRTFVNSVMSSAADAEIVRAIIQMARVLGMKSVAEGVEDAMTMGFLQINRCDQAQGYHVARPMPADDFLAFLRRYDARQAVNG